MLQEINLRELAERQGPPRSFISLYSSGKQALATLRSRATHLRDMLADEPDAAAEFERTLKRLENLLEEESTDAAGVAFFSCGALDFTEGYPLPVELPELVHLDSTAYLRPLAELQDEHENFLIVAADAQSTRVIQVTSAVSETADKVRGNVKNRVKKGGWSQQRYARRRQTQMTHYAKEVAEVLANLCRTQQFDRIVLLGAKEMLEELQRDLPRDVSEKVVGQKGADLHAAESQLVEEGYEVYFEEERQSEQRLWDRIKEEYYQGGLAVAGPTHVLEAARIGRAENILVTRAAQIKATRCDDCGHVVHGTPQTCQSCGSKNVHESDLVDELVRQAELTSALVEFADPIEGLSKVGNVAAMCRW